MSTVYHPEPCSDTSEFTINRTLVNKTSEAIKWNINEERSEIYHGLCTRFELHEILPHCLLVIHKIDGQVGDHIHKKLQSYNQVPPQTLSIPLVGVWEQVIQEYNKANADEAESLASFAKTLKAFIACHSTEDDQHELVSVIRYASKPDNMKVWPFFYQLKELNDYVHYLPGNKPALTNVQLNLAFYNGMPGHWHIRHAILGQSAHSTMRTELLHYFRVQQRVWPVQKITLIVLCATESLLDIQGESRLSTATRQAGC
jgi:hypothetical protein